MCGLPLHLRIVEKCSDGLIRPVLHLRAFLSMIFAGLQVTSTFQLGEKQSSELPALPVGTASSQRLLIFYLFAEVWLSFTKVFLLRQTSIHIPTPYFCDSNASVAMTADVSQKNNLHWRQAQTCCTGGSVLRSRIFSFDFRQRGGIEPLHVSMPLELKSSPSTSPTHPGNLIIHFIIVTTVVCQTAINH